MLRYCSRLSGIGKATPRANWLVGLPVPRCRRSFTGTSFIASSLIGMFLSASATSAAEAPAAATNERAATPLPSRQLTDDIADKLSPQTSRTAKEELDLRALAHYSTGRLLQRRELSADALRQYQRAVLYDPTSIKAIRGVVLLAQDLERGPVVARYAVLLSEQDPQNSLALLRASLHLTSLEEDERLLKLYEQSLAAKAEKRDEVWLELHKLAGSTYHRLDRTRQAADAFTKVRQALANPELYGLDQQAAKLDEQAGQAIYLVMTDVFIEAGRLDSAANALTKARSYQADAAFCDYAEAKILIKRGKAKEAQAKLDDYFSANSEEAANEAYELLRQIHIAQGSEDRFIGRLERLAREHPKNVTLVTFLAEEYLRAGNQAGGRKLHEQLMQSQPSVRSYRSLATIYHEAKEYDALLQLLGDLVTQANTLAPLGDTLSSLTENDKTLAALVEAADKFSEQPIERAFGRFLAVGMLATEAKRFDIAGKFYERVISSNHAERPSVLLAWGLDLLMNEKYAEAAKVLQRGLDEKLFPGDSSIVDYYLAGALSMLDRHEEAIAAVSRALKQTPNSADYQSRLGWILTRAEKLALARAIYESLITKNAEKYDESESREIVRESRLSLSHVLSLGDDPSQAAEVLLQVLDEFPEHTRAKNDLAYLWAEQNQELALAERLSREALAMEPDSAAYRDTLGWIYYRQKNFKDAIKQLTRAVELSERKDGVVLDHLGDALIGANRAEEAVRQWKDALTAFDISGETDKKKPVQEKIVKYTK